MLSRRLLAEGLGSILLAATVIGSGIMAERLAEGNDAVALLANTGATVAALAVLIALLAPISGAHFNPTVTLVMTLRGQMRAADAVAYVLTQLIGCCAGALLAHAMFALPLIQASTHVRAGTSQWLGELVATTGLLTVILGAPKRSAAWMVAGWIGAAYWLTSSTSFANPAITLARSMTDTFAGIRPIDVGPFVVAQIVGSLIAMALASRLFPAADAQKAERDDSLPTESTTGIGTRSTR